MKKTIGILGGIIVTAVVLVAAFAFVRSAFADGVFASTNADNITKGWANVTVVDDTKPGQITLKFTSTRAFMSCFEYRTDGDTTQATKDTNYNPVADKLYPYTCRSNNSVEKTLTAKKFVEVRMVFGAEDDERFGWTKFNVLALPDPTPTVAPVNNTHFDEPGKPGNPPEVCKGSLINQMPLITEARRISPTQVFLKWTGVNSHIQDYVIEYGFGNHTLWGTKVTGLQTTINFLPLLPVSFKVAGTDNCVVGSWSFWHTR